MKSELDIKVKLWFSKQLVGALDQMCFSICCMWARREFTHTRLCGRAGVRVCVRAVVRACGRACVYACLVACIACTIVKGKCVNCSNDYATILSMQW